MDSRAKATLHKDEAERLNKVWGAGAIQSRYRDTGDWYAKLAKFPAALFDARGYVLFATKEEYDNSPYLRIGKQISVPKGISSMPGYVLCAAADANGPGRLPQSPRNTLSFSGFCAQLGAPLRNVRNSWCAYSPQHRRAVFTVWADKLANGRNVFWRAAGAPGQSRQGATEVRRVIQQVMAAGHEALGVLCYAKDVEALPRVRERFVEDTVLLLRFAEEPEGLIGYVQGEVRTADALLGPVARVSPVRSAIDDLDEPPRGADSPERVRRQTQGYRRDDAVRRYVIERARGKCEYCGKFEFLMDNGKPYLESHHIISLASQGPDTVQNVIALCAGHHREAHYGQNAEQLEQEFLRKLEAMRVSRPNQ